jgi:hypothetical protein
LRFILIDQRNSKEVKLEFSAQKKNKKMKKPKTAERDKMSPNSAKSPSSCNIGIYVLDISIMIVYKDYTSPSSQLEV